ncbi:MAG: gamma-glutamyltransferase family protein [Alphaproteobacteria bacterium]
MATERPEIQGSRFAVSSGHYYASQAAFEVLQAGGNAFDAGVAGGLALGVLQSDLVSVAGVAPIILWDAERSQMNTISGLGGWPAASDINYFRDQHGGAIPIGPMRTVVPSAPAAWIAALDRFGTMSFGDVAHYAVRFARDGFPMNALLRQTIVNNRPNYEAYSYAAGIYLSNDGNPPEVGELFYQKDLGASLQFMIDQEATALANGADRRKGLQAARDAFYKGDLARTITDYHRTVGGWLTMQDLADFQVGFEPPVSSSFGDWQVFGCGPWCQGPALMEKLNLLKRFDLKGYGLNSADYIHAHVEATKLVMADRDAYFGDPRFIDVPIETLLSEEYADVQLARIQMGKAFPEMPPPGDASGNPWRGTPIASPPGGEPHPGGALDTTYLCVVDDKGNVFSATPSDGSYNGAVVPGTGMNVSPRGVQSWTDPSHPSSIQPGKRPRLTPNPAIAVRANGKAFLPLGTPGGDVQTQAMAQTFANVAVFGMGPQEAVEQPRFASYSFPSSFEPHDYHPGLLRIEGEVDESIGDDLTGRGHRVERWPDRTWLAGSICMILDDRETGMKSAGADPRRVAYALGW